MSKSTIQFILLFAVYIPKRYIVLRNNPQALEAPLASCPPPHQNQRAIKVGNKRPSPHPQKQNGQMRWPLVFCKSQVKSRWVFILNYSKWFFLFRWRYHSLPPIFAGLKDANSHLATAKGFKKQGWTAVKDRFNAENKVKFCPPKQIEWLFIKFMRICTQNCGRWALPRSS